MRTTCLSCVYFITRAFECNEIYKKIVEDLLLLREFQPNNLFIHTICFFSVDAMQSKSDP